MLMTTSRSDWAWHRRLVTWRLAGGDSLRVGLTLVSSLN